MTNDTQHPEIALQMRWAHKALGTWEAVARLCGDNPRTGLPVKSALAWWYASGRRPIPDAVVETWQANVTPAMLKRWAPRARQPRVSIEVPPDTHRALRNSIKKPGDTWADAFSRILSDTEPGSAAHLFSLLTKRTLEAVLNDLGTVHEYPLGYPASDAEQRAVAWLVDRLELELSMRQTPDWAREE